MGAHFAPIAVEGPASVLAFLFVIPEGNLLSVSAAKAASYNHNIPL